MNHEEKLAKAFVLPTHGERYLEFVRMPKNRTKFVHELGHFQALNPKLRLLTGKGAGSNGWVVSEYLGAQVSTPRRIASQC
jgi:hypothetical protein